MIEARMAFSDDVNKLLNKKWSYSNTFTVQFQFTEFMKRIMNWNDDTTGRDINMNIVSVNTPDFSNQPIEIYVGGQYRHHNGKDELYRFSITFRDENQMSLYTKFLTAYRVQKQNYFNDIKMDVIISKDADYIGEVDKRLIILSDTMIEGVSNLDINNTDDAQVAQFTVKFKCSSPNPEKPSN